MMTGTRAGWRVGVALLFLASATAAAVSVPGDYATIQAALDDVVSGPLPSGTVIEVQPGTYMEALHYANTPKSIILRGVAGPAGTIVNSAGTGLPVLTVIDVTGTVRMEGFTMTGANGANGGGGFFSNSTPTLANCVIQGNHSDNLGGGLLIFTSNAVIDNCTIESNTAGLGGGGVTIVDGLGLQILNSKIQNNTSGLAGVGIGAGVQAEHSSVTIRSSSLTGNQGTFAGGGIYLIGQFGSPSGPATLTLEDSEVSDNTVTRPDAGSPPAEGGGIHIENNALAQITRSRIENNTANTGGGLNSFRGRLELIDSVVEGNHAQDPQAIGGFGGGVQVHSLPDQAGAVILTDSVVRNNDARLGGGLLALGSLCGAGGVCAEVTLTRALIDSNVANVHGGGVYVGDAVLTVTDSQVLRNHAIDVGGGGGGGFLISSSTANITNTTIAGNVAGLFGGGLFIDGGANVSVGQSNLYDNATTISDGGGGVFVGQAGPPTGSIQNSQIADNSDFQIREQACPGSVAAPILSYAFNAITNQGLTKIYKAPCYPEINDITTFNLLSPGAKTVGNTDDDPSFTSLAATPPQATSVLAWSSPRSGTVNIANVVDPQPGPTGSLDVTPDCTTLYTLDSASATVIGTGTLSPPATCNGSKLVLFNQDLGGTDLKEAEKAVEAEQVTILAGGDVTFLAGDRIVIRDDFVVENGATFTGATDACLCQ